MINLRITNQEELETEKTKYLQITKTEVTKVSKILTEEYFSIKDINDIKLKIGDWYKSSKSILTKYKKGSLENEFVEYTTKLFEEALNQIDKMITKHQQENNSK